MDIYYLVYMILIYFLIEKLMPFLFDIQHRINQNRPKKWIDVFIVSKKVNKINNNITDNDFIENESDSHSQRSVFFS